MLSSTLAIALSVLISAATAQTQVGASGVLTKTDAGLGGTVTVKNANTLEITSFTLKEASAPALYWWGTTDGILKNGFRISNTQVTQAATSNVLDIPLDAGKTIADFNGIGLWCERLSANFGQASLSGGSGGSATNNSAAPGTSAATPAATTKSGGNKVIGSMGVMMGALTAAVWFAAWMA